MASAAWTSTRTSPVCTGIGNGSAGGRPGPNLPSTSSAQTLPKVTLPTRSSMSTPRYRREPPSLSGSAITPSRPGTKSSAISHAPLRAGLVPAQEAAHDCGCDPRPCRRPRDTRGGRPVPSRTAGGSTVPVPDCDHGGRARPLPHAQGLRDPGPPRGRPRAHLGRAVRPLVRRRRRRRAARAQRRGGRHRGRRRRSRRAHRAAEGLRRGRFRLRDQLRLHQGRPAGGEPARGPGLPLARAAAAGARDRPGRAGGRLRQQRPVGPPSPRRATGRRRVDPVDDGRLPRGAGRAAAPAGRRDRRGEAAAARDLGRLPGGARLRRVLAGRGRPAARPAALRPRRRGGRRLGRPAAGPVSGPADPPGPAPYPVDPVEGAGPVEEPVPLPPRQRRAWAIDTTPLRNPDYRRLFWGLAATMLGQQMTLVAVPYQVYALTGSSLLVGVTSVVALVPLIVFGLLGGAIADSMDRRRLMLVTGVGSAVTSALLAVPALLARGGPGC